MDLQELRARFAAGELTRRAFLQRSLEMGVGAGLLASCGMPRAEDAGLAAGAGAKAAATMATNGADLTLTNALIDARWSIDSGSLRARGIVDRAGRHTLEVGESVFALVLADGSTLDSTQMRVVGAPAPAPLALKPGASRMGLRLPGRQITLSLEDPAARVRALWRAILHDDGRYLRQELTLQAMGAPLPVREIVLVNAAATTAKVTGTVDGSPVASGNWFLGFEHPLSTCSVVGGRIRCALARELPIRPGAPFTVSSVIGVARSGQMRRDFLGYLERERAHPYRPFLHYNSWYDIGYFSKFSEPEALAVIETFGEQLVKQRGVVLDSFLFDDGWDDPRTLWGFHAGFPNGFTPVKAATERYGSAPGVWLSPWGGYGKPKDDRLTYGKAQGFETNAGGFALSGPKYYERFRQSCLDMVRKYGVNQFKLDGTGNAATAFPGSIFDSDFDAAIHLIDDLRGEKPDIYINLTTGTYPSPFWLRFADSIWRGGEDHDFAGVGSFRQQWITYKDGDVFTNVVQRGALYPLNSLMLHGLIYARHAKNLDTDPQRDFASEVHAYFGNGTQLQEMYVTPVLTSQEWDTIAEGAKWSRGNAATLVDTHWLGGDPTKLQVYGWGSWSPRKAIVTLRNPSDKPQRFAFDPSQALELPDGATRRWSARSPWSSDRGRAASVMLQAGTEHVVELEPFQVLTLEMDPK